MVEEAFSACTEQGKRGLEEAFQLAGQSVSGLQGSLLLSIEEAGFRGLRSCLLHLSRSSSLRGNWGLSERGVKVFALVKPAQHRGGGEPPRPIGPIWVEVWCEQRTGKMGQLKESGEKRCMGDC